MGIDMHGWFGKEKKPREKPTKKGKNADSLEEFKDVLEKSLTEEKTGVIEGRKQHSKSKAMVKVLLNKGFTIEEINGLIHSRKTFLLKDGEIIEK
jgi:hypothetical protein